MEPGIDAKLVVVVKDPRGWVQSARRRKDDSLQNLQQYWTDKNNLILDFAQSAGVPIMMVSYDLVAGQPEKHFRNLFEFCGLAFDKSCLAYWKREHHGFAANGASDAFIRSAGLKAPAHFASGDDGFYETHSQRSFHDQRWRETLSLSDQKAIRHSRGAADVLARLKLRMTPVGIRPLGLLRRAGRSLLPSA